MKLFDRVKRLFGGGDEKQAVAEAVREGEIELPATRYYFRAVKRHQRLKGPGYTRAMRKGRTQRGSHV